jgi:hypothetical protein
VATNVVEQREQADSLVLHTQPFAILGLPNVSPTLLLPLLLLTQLQRDARRLVYEMGREKLDVVVMASRLSLVSEAGCCCSSIFGLMLKTRIMG